MSVSRAQPHQALPMPGFLASCSAAAACAGALRHGGRPNGSWNPHRRGVSDHRLTEWLAVSNCLALPAGARGIFHG